ncbi:MAG: GumC family protein, partial [Planctomycetota bacterium]
MSTNENHPLADDVARAPALPARRSALLEPQEAGWGGAGELAGPPEPQAPTLSPSAFLHGLRRHWVLATSLGLLCAAVLGVGMYFVYGAHYTANAYFQIGMSEEFKVFQTPGKERFTEAAFDIYKQTQAQLLTSPDVLNTALGKDVVFQERTMPAGSLPCVKRAESWGYDPIVWLHGKLEVGFPKESQIMQVSFTAGDPEEAAVLLDQVVKAYQSEIVDREQQQRADRLNELDHIHGDRQEELTRKWTQLNRVIQQVNTSDPDTLKVKQQVAVQQFGDIQRLHSQARARRQAAEIDLAGQQTRLANVDKIPIPELDLEEYASARPELIDLYRERAARMMARDAVGAAAARAESRWEQQHKQDVEDLDKMIEELGGDAEEKIREKMRADIQTKIDELKVQTDGLKDQESQLAKDVANQRQEMEQLAKSSIELAMVQGEVDRLDTVLSSVDEERGKLEVEQGAKPRVTRRGNTEQPKQQSKRAVRIALAVLASLVGLCVPVGIVAWWDTRAERINSHADVSRKLGLTVLGSIPTIPARAIRQLGSSSKRHESWHLRLTESIDGIAARLLRQADVEQTRVILVSSATSGEGKTTLATQLAMSFARNGRRTALVDFDL